MRILLLSDALAPHTRRWANWFADRGHIIKVISFNHSDCGGYRPDCLCKVATERERRFVPRIVRAILIYFRAKKAIRRFRPDIVHAHSAGAYSWLASTISGVPVVISPWGTDILIDIEKSRVNKMLTKWALRTASHITTDAEHFFGPLERLQVPSEKILLHQFGTDVELFRPPIEGRQTNAGDTIRIISTRTPTPVHQVDLAIRALAILADRNVNVELTVVGAGSALGDITELADQLHLRDRLHFVGMVTDHLMSVHLQNAELYISTSAMDAGLAASTAEAMASGLPVIHSNNSDNAMWVSDNEGGYLFDTGSAVSLADAIEKAILNKSKWNDWGHRNRMIIERKYNRDIEMRKIETLYSDLL